MILLDTSVLNNFARIEQLDLLRLALPDAATTPQVLAELERGVASGYLATEAWDWLDVVRLTPSEKANLVRIRLVLDDGEASCIAVAIERNASLFSDDMDARRYARRQGISVSGTVGVLSLLIKGSHLSRGGQLSEIDDRSRLPISGQLSCRFGCHAGHMRE